MADLTRVCHIALQLETGGMERLLVEFARHADRSRYALRFVALSKGGRIAGEIEACGWPVTVLNIRDGVRPTAVFRLASHLREHPADVVHTHNTRPLLYAAPAAQLAGVPAVVHTRHGQRHGASRRQDMLFRWACAGAARIVCVSEDAARWTRLEGIGGGKVRTIMNGIDTTRFSDDGRERRGPAVYVGRLSVEKDVATLLRAVAMVVRQHPEFRLRIAGTGACETELRELAAVLGLGGAVEFLGEVTNVPALLRGASVFVLPSLTEGVPLTVLEAMSCGLPVVATRVGGTPEAVADGVTGILVPPGDPERLAEALLELGRDGARARAMGLAGRERAIQHFDVRAMVGRYESIYGEVLAGGARATA